MFFSTLILGAKTLLLHPLRSSLTVLGIFIGVASVIWLLAIGEGISIQAQRQIEGLGASNIIVYSKKPPSESSSGQQQWVLNYGLTRDDFRRIKELVPTLVQAVPLREVSRRFTYGTRLVDGQLVGCTPDYSQLAQLEIDRGEPISEVHIQSRENVCVLAHEVADALFLSQDPIGRSIRVENAYYVVIGVMKPRAANSSIGGADKGKVFSRDVYIPITTFWSRIGDFVQTSRSGSREFELLQLTQITVKVDKVENVIETADLVRSLVKEKHRQDDFDLTVPLKLLEQARTTRLLFIVFMGLIAAVSLVVGGIGIMNIMLATVTERTREIGIRRALGARRSDITTQFLVETIMLSVVGGVIGIGGGLLCGPAINAARDVAKEFMGEQISALPEVVQNMEPLIVPWSIPLAFGIAVAVGVIFGLYPAMRAARMDPVEALRHE